MPVPIALPLLLAVASSGDIRISTANESRWELQAVDQLERILREHDVGRWMFTREIRVESQVIPHSHPVLTLNTRYLDHDRGQLSTLLHEQFHWWAVARDEATDAAVEEFQALFPEVPDRAGGGARNDHSTYLHLVICDLEYQALAAVIGDADARELLAGKTYYQWVYRQVLDDVRVRAVNARHGLLAAFAGPPPELQVRTVNGTDEEEATASRVRELVERYDLADLTFTGEIAVEDGTIPHSHPVLTLAPREGERLLADFVHEQLHWMEEWMPMQREAAMAEFVELFPEVPVRGGQGARDEQSTYLHLIVCDLELQALERLLGAARARELLGTTRHYRWIYKTVLEDPRVREVNRRHGFVVPD